MALGEIKVHSAETTCIVAGVRSQYDFGFVPMMTGGARNDVVVQFTT